MTGQGMTKFPQKLPFHYGWLIVGTGILTLFACLGLARFAFGMLLPGMREGLALGYDQMGYVGTGNFIGYLVSVAVTPMILRRLQPRVTITIGLLLIALCLAGMARCQSFWPLLLLYTLAGVGSGLANIPMMVLIAHWFRRERRGRAAGLMIVGNGSAIVFAGLLIPWLNQLYGQQGWRVSWQLLAGIVLLIGLLIGLLVRNAPEPMGLEPIGRKQPLGTAELEAAEPSHPGRILLFLGLLYLAFGATYMVYGTFIVTSMVEEFGFSEATAGQFWSWVGFFSLFSGVVFGGLSDRVGRRLGLMLVFCVQTLAYLLAGSGLGTLPLMASVVLYGISAFAIPAIMAAAVGDYMGIAKAASAFSLITFFFAGGQTLGPALAGILAESSGSFAPAFLLSALVTGIAAACSLKLPKPTGS
jgi:MFS family permease